MKIAIFFVGHLRTWVACKKNILSHLIDDNHSIDVFVETYNNIFRFDYGIRNESNQKIIENEQQIRERFSGFNVVHMSIEEQSQLAADPSQATKIQKCFRVLNEFEEKNGKYDLIVKTRPDLFFEEKIDYNSYENLEENKLILGRKATIHVNDTFAIGRSDTIKKYLNRYTITSNYCPYKSISALAEKEKITLDEKVDHYIVRLPLSSDLNCNFVKSRPHLNEEIPLLDY